MREPDQLLVRHGIFTCDIFSGPQLLVLGSCRRPVYKIRCTMSKLLKSTDAHYIHGCVLACVVQVQAAAARLKGMRYQQVQMDAHGLRIPSHPIPLDEGPVLRIPEHAGRTGTRAVGVTIHPLREVDLLFRHHGSPANPPAHSGGHLLSSGVSRRCFSVKSSPFVWCVCSPRFPSSSAAPRLACLACLVNGCLSPRASARSARL